MDAADKKKADGLSNDMDTSISVLGKRARTTEVTMGTGTPVDGSNGKRPRSEAQWWNPELNPQVEAHQSSVAGDVGGAVSARVADECNTVLGQELSPEEEEQHAGLVEAAKIREHDSRRKFDVFEQFARARRVLT